MMALFVIVGEEGEQSIPLLLPKIMLPVIVGEQLLQQRIPQMPLFVIVLCAMIGSESSWQ